MESTWEYACFNGTNIIGEPGTLDHAIEVKNINRLAAWQAGDKSRANYHIVKRRISYGKWMKHE